MKFITSLLAFFLFASAISYSQSNKAKRITTNLNPLPIVTVTGDEPANLKSIPYTGNIQEDQNREPRKLFFTDSIISITDVYMGESSLYDLQSNSVTQQLQQWYKDTLHAVFMQNLVSGVTSTDRRTKYIVSTDHGTTWSTLGEVGSTVGIISGYAAIYLTSDGRAVVGDHAAETVVGQHPCIYHDLAPLVGVWSLCDVNGLAATTRVWLRFVVTNSGKVPFISAYNIAAPGADTLSWINVLTNPSGCNFSGFNVKTDMDNAEQYSMEKAGNGTIGIAYITNDFNPANAGDVRYISSTDEGATWSTPTTIYDATPNPDDYMGALRGVDLVYVGNTPNVVFALVHENNAGGYYPGLNGRIMFWNPNVNSGNPVLLADSTKVPDRPIQGANTINDVYPNICRPTIGKSRNGSMLYCTFSVARAETSPNADSTPYMDVYFAWSNNQGANWQDYKQLTNLSGPLRDCRYPCLSPVNDNDNYYYANLVYVSDSIPGSAVNGAVASLAKFRFIRVQLPDVFGVKNIGTEIPKNFVLNQNYPNPFNPSTKITFDLPTNEFVTLKVYDVTGREIAALVNEKLTAGMKEYEFNAVNLPSGVYFYTIQAGDFKATRKMVLIK